MIIWNNGFRASRKAMLSCRYAFALSFFHFFILYFFTSCSQDQVPPEEPKPEKQEKAIAFSGNMMEEEVTRAESTTPLNEKGVTYFRVWAFKNDGPQNDPYSTYQTVMPGYYVRYEASSSSTTNSSGWDYILTAFPDQTPKYWDMEAKAYRFFAVTGTSFDATVTQNTTDGTYETSFTANALNESSTPYYSKLWFSDNTGTNLFGEAVTLEFIKPLAKVRFIVRVVKNSENELDPTLKDYSFHPMTEGEDIYTNCTYTVTYPITGTGTEESWSTTEFDELTSMAELSTPWKEGDNSVTPAIPAGPWYTVVPNRNQGAYEFSLTVNGEEKDCTVPAQYMVWLPSYSYTYIFKINESGGVELDMVHTGVINWNDGGEQKYDLYNW